MPKALHNKILTDVKKAHPEYSAGRAEQETNAVLTNIGKKKAGKRVRKARSSPVSRKKRTSKRK